MARRRDQQIDSLVSMFGALRGDYDAARKTRFKRARVGVVADGSGADHHYRNWYAYAQILETARDLVRNHPLIGQGVRRLVSNVLRGGFTYDPRTNDKALNNELRARWSEWAYQRPDDCDVAGESLWSGIERMTLRHVIVDGDLLTLPLATGQIQQIENHRLRTPSRTRRNVVHGVLLDEHRKRLEYWVTRDNVDPMSAVNNVSDMVRYPTRAIDPITERPERQVLHHYLPDRVSQTRGVTAMVPVVDMAGMQDDLMFATLVKSQMNACVTILREMAATNTALPPAVGNDGVATTSEPRPDGSTRLLAGWQPGMEIFGFPGEQLKGFAPNVPNAEFFTFSMLILSIIAVNLDLPVAVFLLDPSNTNFSGWRGAIDQARQRFQELQRFLIDSLHTPVIEWKIRQWAAEDPHILAAVRKHIARQRAYGDSSVAVNPFAHEWHAEEWPYIEPISDATADVIQERNLLTSPRRRAARRGMQFSDIVDETMEDRAYVIRQAAATATALNAEIPGANLTWRDLAQFGPPDGVNISVAANPPASSQPTAGGSNAQQTHTVEVPRG